ncbi:hypothetical protein ACF06W_29325 [Streptomyces albus]|uniref:hypothetical protein n=1 Tax=Streptomyces albus TaxID=1888 RepID=UPI003701D1AA
MAQRALCHPFPQTEAAGSAVRVQNDIKQPGNADSETHLRQVADTFDTPAQALVAFE